MKPFLTIRKITEDRRCFSRIERSKMKHMRDYEQQAAFEQCIRFLAEMIEKYAERVEFPVGTAPDCKDKRQ